MGEEDDALQKKKSHRERHSGRKAEKKKAKNPHVQELTDKQRNPKAFTFNSAVRAERRFRRKQDIETKKQHIPLIDRTPVEPPPVIVAVVGPPKVGKSTLIQCLIKTFTKQPLTSLKGPVTLVSGKKKRLTLIECNNDINSMIDIAKVADLVLLLVDASFGFEMEIFEFLNICQVHGMPRVMGVLTHLDMLKNNKQLKKTKKTLKHRFWAEVYAGAKLFYLSGMLHGEYMRNEVKNLGRFISVMKFRPLTWRTSHPYILADRLEDLTPPELVRQNPKVDRLVSFYGYVRGVALNKTSSVHIPGCGDLKIHDVSYLPDPCPLPDKLKKRTLVEKERLVYAPFSGVGGIVYDKDSVYVELGGSHSHAFRDDDKRPEKALVSSLLDTQETLDMKMARSELRLFSGTAPITSSDVTEGIMGFSQEFVGDMGRSRRKVVFPGDEKINSDSDSDDSDDELVADEDDFSSESDDDNKSEVKLELMQANEVSMKKKKNDVYSDGTGMKVNEDLDSDDMGESIEGKINKENKKKKIRKMKEMEVDNDEDEVSEDKVDKKKKKKRRLKSTEDLDDVWKLEVDKVEKKTKIKDKVTSENSVEEENMEVEMGKKKKKKEVKQKGGDGGEKLVSAEDSDSDDHSQVLKHDGAKTDVDNILNVEAKGKRKEPKNAIAAAESRLLKIMGEDSDELELEEEEEEEEGIPVKKRKLSEDKIVESRPIRYRDIKSEQDQAIHSKISGVLTELESSKRKKPRRGKTDVEEDIDADQDVRSLKHKDASAFELSQYSSSEDSSDDNMEELADLRSSGGEDSEEEGQEESAVRWKADLAQKAADAFLERQTNTQNLWKLVYGDLKHKMKMEEKGLEAGSKDAGSDEEVGGLFKVVKRTQEYQQEQKDLMNVEDCAKFEVKQVRDWTESDVCKLIQDCFVTGKWKESEDAAELLRLDEASDDELFGDFEDLETGEKHTSKSGPKEEEEEETDDRNEATDGESKKLSREELQEKKRKLKEKFDAEYDDKEGDKSYYDELKQEVNLQAQLNKNEFEGLDDSLRIQLEGFRPGMYVRLEVDNVPCELITNFDPTYPLVVGGLLSGEENIGFVQVRIKKHRWHKKILKTRDPLIFSLGWRRFQTLPIYCKLEDNMRHRMLKYTPEHVTCTAHFWGPITPQTTGFLAVQDIATRQTNFRIAATGSVVELDKSTQIMKKLKLTGSPYKIYKKTAFIKDMFNSTLEVAKFEGARLKTVSGIRGQIKRAVSKPEGAFRATFEDKVRLSDIVICRTWYRMEVPRLYNPVTSLLLPPEEKNLWRGMKTVGQLKREKGLHSEPAYDSLYTPIERSTKVFRPLVIPPALQKELPYKDRPKNEPKVQKKKAIESGRVAVVREPHEQKVASLMKMLKASYNHRQEQMQEAAKKRVKEYKKEKDEEYWKKMKRQRELKKQVFRTLSKMEAKNKPKNR